MDDTCQKASSLKVASQPPYTTAGKPYPVSSAVVLTVVGAAVQGAAQDSRAEV